MERINLTDEERSNLRTTFRKTGWTTRVEYANGPRGGKYRPARTRVAVGENAALEQAQAIIDQPLKSATYVKSAVMYEVDFLGRVVDETVLRGERVAA